MSSRRLGLSGVVANASSSPDLTVTLSLITALKIDQRKELERKQTVECGGVCRENTFKFIDFFFSVFILIVNIRQIYLKFPNRKTIQQYKQLIKLGMTRLYNIEAYIKCILKINDRF